MKGHTHPGLFKRQCRGIDRDQNGKEHIAFEGTARINRQEYGLTWGQPLEIAAPLSDAVELEIATIRQ
jgi:polyisoprenoid-binding protein YceI